MAEVNIVGMVAIVVFYLLILAIGLWAARKRKESEEEAMLAGRSIGMIIGTFTLTGKKWSLEFSHAQWSKLWFEKQFNRLQAQVPAELIIAHRQFGLVVQFFLVDSNKLTVLGTLIPKFKSNLLFKGNGARSCYISKKTTIREPIRLDFQPFCEPAFLRWEEDNTPDSQNG